MDTREITIRVGAEAAKVYAAASEEERGKIDLLLSLRLSEVTGPAESLEQVMRETSKAAQERGLAQNLECSTVTSSLLERVYCAP